MDSELRARAEAVIGYRFRDPSHLERALTHASLASSRLASNERMEFLGDAILGMVVCEYLYTTFDRFLEGDLTKVKSAVVSRRMCARVARDLELDRALQIGKGMMELPRLPSSLAAAAFESIIAAIYCDGGYEPVRDFILRTLQDEIHTAVQHGHHFNFKSVLQQHVQTGMNGDSVVYRVVEEDGPDHAKRFCVRAVVGSREFECAWAASKKLAEQEAALNALVALGMAEVSEGAERTIRLLSSSNNGTIILEDHAPDDQQDDE